MARLAWWPFDEASSGTTPTTVGDNDASPVNLTITYAGTAAWTSIAAGNGLNINGQSGAFAKSAGTNGTKIDIEGFQTLTLGVVLNWDPAATFAYGYEWPGSADVFWIQSVSGVLSVYNSQAGGAFGTVDASAITSGVKTLHVVYETTNGTQNNRVRWFINGSQVGGQTSTLTLNATIGTDASSAVLTLGNQADGGGPFPGAIYAAALYDTALSDGDISSFSTNWLADNDADPDVGGGGGGGDAPTPQGGLAFIGGMGGGLRAPRRPGRRELVGSGQFARSKSGLYLPRRLAA